MRQEVGVKQVTPSGNRIGKLLSAEGKKGGGDSRKTGEIQGRKVADVETIKRILGR